MNVRARTAKLSTETRKRQETRGARIAELEVRATTVTVKPPYRKGHKLPEVTLNVVLAEESHPPDGETPIQWLLVTTLPIDNPEQVQQIVSYYSTRWQIETNHAHYVQRFTFSQGDTSAYSGNQGITGSGAMAPAMPAWHSRRRAMSDVTDDRVPPRAKHLRARPYG